MSIKNKLFATLAGCLLAAGAHAQVKIAVADLTYKDTVRQSFYYEAGYAKSSERASSNERESGFSASASGRYSNDQEAAYVKAAGTYEMIEYGQLRKFTGDIKGALISTRAFRVTQARPYVNPEGGEQIFDVIAQIKKGYYPGADYVLFGVVDSVEWRNDTQPVDNTNTTTILYSLSLGAEFSLINTHTYEVKAAFSAVGDGNDNKIWSSGARLTPNKARVMQQVSQSLAQEVVSQLTQQFGGGVGGSGTEPLDQPGGTAPAQSQGVKVYE
ncbi:penicillin-binding protein activator LpoB [Trinickia fusca]|uniref:Penicillin-binding protein activator LpoB n=1 Tax=Trinickia fusca TaxID=2419777 RepID=A0A494X085_9BURK|nr:penicillin-binding protein activator LpoB [Trinickia fusca]RKP44117.1 penicillin-binding protein activator LpoB [Trinickia fusca]